MPVPGTDDGVHDWTFISSEIGSTKEENLLAKGIVEGAIYALTSTGVANTILQSSKGKVTKIVLDHLLSKVSYNPPKYYWWASTWHDKDAEAIYVRHHIKVYSDSSRSNKVADYWDYETY